MSFKHPIPYLLQQFHRPTIVLQHEVSPFLQGLNSEEQRVARSIYLSHLPVYLIVGSGILTVFQSVRIRGQSRRYGWLYLPSLGLARQDK